MNLQHLHVVVTRPDPEGSELCALIDSYQGHALHWPTIAFTPPTDMADFLAKLTQLDKQDWLIFISPQAVRTSINAIKQQWPHFPAHVKVAAIGGSTAKLLQEHHIHAIYPKEDWHSEGLLALPAFQVLDQKKIAIIHGEGGRETFARTLEQRGAQILSMIAYQRTIPEITKENWLPFIQQKKIDAIITTSGEGTCHLKIMCGETLFRQICKIPLIVVSERIKILAQDLGFQTIWVAAHANHVAILELLAKKRKEIWQMKKKK